MQQLNMSPHSFGGSLLKMIMLIEISCLCSNEWIVIFHLAKGIYFPMLPLSFPLQHHMKLKIKSFLNE